MKKIDLHIHTVSTISDRPFTFSLDAFKRYVTDAKLDAVAVTNHDVFDGAQFRHIQEELAATVFPGIEINVGSGHLLIITKPSDLDDFASKTTLVSQRITKVGDSMSFEELIKIFGNLQNYLLIPHYDKGPPIAGETLEKLRPYISAGEVDIRPILGTASTTSPCSRARSIAIVSTATSKCASRATQSGKETSGGTATKHGRCLKKRSWRTKRATPEPIDGSTTSKRLWLDWISSA